MLKPGYYSGKSEREIASDLGSEGLTPKRIVERPGSRYDNHRNYDEIIMAFLQGSADIVVGSQAYPCKAGDRLHITAGMDHSGTVGPDGCTYMMTLAPVQSD